jgi:chemotaxis signal transduction protein
MTSGPPDPRREEIASHDSEWAGGSDFDAVTNERILRARARELARPAVAAGAGERSFVEFAVGRESYAVEAHLVHGTFRAADVAPLPGTAVGIAGVAAWRGELLVVLDLPATLGHGATAAADRTWIVVIGDERRRRGLLAGEIRGFVGFRDHDLKPARGGEAGSPSPFLRGITAKAVHWLDAAALLGTTG